MRLIGANPLAMPACRFAHLSTCYLDYKLLFSFNMSKGDARGVCSINSHLSSTISLSSEESRAAACSLENSKTHTFYRPPLLNAHLLAQSAAKSLTLFNRLDLWSVIWPSLIWYLWFSFLWISNRDSLCTQSAFWSRKIWRKGSLFKFGL